jgi:hypothetical protein
MKDPNDTNTKDCFMDTPKRKGRPPLYKSVEDVRTENRARQFRFQEKKRYTKKALEFASQKLVEAKKNDNTVEISTLTKFIICLQIGGDETEEAQVVFEKLNSEYDQWVTFSNLVQMINDPDVKISRIY